MISDAATRKIRCYTVLPVCSHIPMPLSLVGVELLAILAFSASAVMVAVEGEREKVLARGARCVSLSSVRFASQ